MMWKKETATHAIGAQERQYTQNEVVKAIAREMFTAFVQTASHGSGAKVLE